MSKIRSKQILNLKKPKTIREIIDHVNESYLLNGDKLISKTTLHNKTKYLERTISRPGPKQLKVPQQLLETMKLHIKVLQLSKQGQASGTIIKK